MSLAEDGAAAFPPDDAPLPAPAEDVLPALGRAHLAAGAPPAPADVSAPPEDPHVLVGRRVRRLFQEGWFEGNVTSVRRGGMRQGWLWFISYEDNDSEELTWAQLVGVLLPEEGAASAGGGGGAQCAPRGEPLRSLQVAGGGAPGGVQRYKGVAWHRKAQRWSVRLHLPRDQNLNLGSFPVDAAEAAARCYDAAVRRRGGTVVNFPVPGSGETQAHYSSLRCNRRCSQVPTAQLLQAPAAVPPSGRNPRTGFRGVCRNGRRFQAYYYTRGMKGTHYIGNFATAHESARAHDAYCRRIGAPASYLNFRDGDTDVGAGAEMEDEEAAEEEEEAAEEEDAEMSAEEPVVGPHAGLRGTGFRGVSRRKCGRFMAQNAYNGAYKYLGVHATALAAARVVDAYCRSIGVPASLLNFPDDDADADADAGADAADGGAEEVATAEAEPVAAVGPAVARLPRIMARAPSRPAGRAPPPPPLSLAASVAMARATADSQPPPADAAAFVLGLQPPLSAAAAVVATLARNGVTLAHLAAIGGLLCDASVSDVGVERTLRAALDVAGVHAPADVLTIRAGLMYLPARLLRAEQQRADSGGECG